MNLTNYYWYFESAVPPRICDMIVQYGRAEKKREIMAIISLTLLKHHL